jgi:integrase
MVPLAPLVIEIIRSLPRYLNSDFVFTTTGRTPISGFGRLKHRLEAAVGPDAEDWRIHDLRRTVATNMAMSKVQPQVIEAVLNHKSGLVSGVAAIYNRHNYFDEKRQALEKWARELAAIAGIAVGGDDDRDQEGLFREAASGFPDRGAGKLWG